MTIASRSTRAGIVEAWREFTGLSEITDISAADVAQRINNHYTNDFVKQVKTDNFQADYTQDTANTDSGSYALPSNIIDLQVPVMLDGSPIALYRDQEQFLAMFPDDSEDYTTPPTLAIGTDTTKVLNAAFSYKIGSYVYTKASAETVLSGDTIPDGKHGAYLLTIDDDGTITVTDGAANATGWDTVAEAINDLSAAPANSAIMGFVVVYTSGATFVPGTTGLDAATVTDTYTDGNPDLRGIPQAALVIGRTFIVRPKAIDIYRITFPMTLKKPVSLAADGDTVFNEEWGTAIAMGDAIAYLTRLGADEKAERLMGRSSKPGTYEYLMRSIRGETLGQERARVVYRSW